MNEAFLPSQTPLASIWCEPAAAKVIPDPWLGQCTPAVMPPSTLELQQKEIIRLNGEIRNLYDHIEDLNQHCSMMLDRIEKLEKRSPTSRQKK